MSIAIEGSLRRPVIAWLQSQGMNPVFEVWCSSICDIVGVAWHPRVGRSIPEIADICAIELKMDDVAGAIRQCSRYRYSIPNCWAAMPLDRIWRMRPSTHDKFVDAGIGLIAVDKSSCRVILYPVKSGADPSSMKNKLWARREEWKDRIDCQRFKPKEAI